MITITLSNTIDDYKQIEVLADIIWREHYIPIVGKPQIDYMLNKFQSASAIASQVDNGFEYYTVYYNKIPVGYISTKREVEALFLSKLYILSNYRGKNLGRVAILYITEKAEAYQLEKIRLTVNIHNTNSIIAYKKLGFVKMRPVVADIGNGFIMDDYEMIKKL